jgi:predicted helicase
MPRSTSRRALQGSPTPTPDQILRKCRNRLDFCSLVDPFQTTKAKGDAFERLVQLYLAIDPQYRTKLRKVWLYDEVPQKVRRHRRLPARDKGIDLIAETEEGRYRAIQAKYRAEASRSLTFRELSTFARSRTESPPPRW